ncbi:hypothetical protein IGI04_007248 [Brassica rapa subsp. trilocularis]|uniref:RING-type domain-containing protein n=1 Tax=Brassica rapa subsp. trilocularis TaxID=1813537 RepID=A0ABQ7NJ82_BRACM|nr:hypothetical protein IGI04_007248 [Brassica rapa subsp. trilocularis]
MSNLPLISHRLSHQTRSTGENPKQTLQVYIHRPNTQQSIIDFQLPSIIDIQETTQYVMNEVRDNINILANDLQVTLIIKDYNQNATSRLDIDLIITDLEGPNRPPTIEEENDICIVCFGNYNDRNNLFSVTCGHIFHFACIDQ